MSATISEMIDPTKTARYNVRLGEGLLAEEGSTSSNYSTVIYNHKPDQPTDSSTTTTIFPSDSTSGLYELKLENQNDPRDIYTFQGSGRSASESYALIYDPKTDEWILDRVDANFVFNLTSTPSSADADDLAAKYPQLELDVPPEDENENAGSDCGESEGEAEGNAEAEDMFDAVIDDDDAPADDDNPFDWRHFVAISPTRSRSASPLPSGSGFGFGSDESLILDLDDEAEANLPPPTSSSPISTPTPSRPSRPKPKPKPKPRSRRLTTPPPPPKDEDADNEASDADADADDGVLTIEMDPETRPRRHLGAELVRPASAAPISLRSAASSVSPRPHGRKADSEGEDEARGERESESEVESDEDADGVELLPLSSSPPAPAAAGADADAPTPGDGDAEDELEAELAQALESQEVGVAGGSEVVAIPPRTVESSSESEEE